MRAGLNAAKVASLVKAGDRGLWGDGAGLYLRTDKNRASWMLRYKVAGRERQMGLGEVSLRDGEPGLSLAQARIEGARWRALLRDGRDPITEREVQRKALAAEATAKENLAERDAASSFKTVAETMLDSREAEWRNAKHRA